MNFQMKLNELKCFHDKSLEESALCLELEKSRYTVLKKLMLNIEAKDQNVQSQMNCMKNELESLKGETKKSVEEFMGMHSHGTDELRNWMEAQRMDLANLKNIFDKVREGFIYTQEKCSTIMNLNQEVSLMEVEVRKKQEHIANLKFKIKELDKKAKEASNETSVAGEELKETQSDLWKEENYKSELWSDVDNILQNCHSLLMVSKKLFSEVEEENGALFNVFSPVGVVLDECGPSNEKDAEITNAEKQCSLQSQV